MNLKQKIHEQCWQKINEKIDSFRNILDSLRESEKNETKNSAGDKFETARAMLQIEQENIKKQLKEALEQKVVFEKIDISIHSNQVIKGSLVKTNKGYLFLSVALGKIEIDGIMVISLSAQSALGEKISGLKVADFTEVNGIKYEIEEID